MIDQRVEFVVGEELSRFRDTEMRRRIAAAVQELWASDELRAVSPTVLDEVRAGLIYFTSTLARVVPAIYRDLDAAVRESYPGEEVVVPPLLTFGSWMGGDRDGNPNVTPKLTAVALGHMKETCLTHLERVVGELAGRITLSAPPAVEVAASALTKTNNGPAVWVVDLHSHTVSLRGVDVLRYDPATVVISHGLETGDVVVTAGAQTLRPGQQVRMTGGVS